MVGICFYFQVHQSAVLNAYKVFDIGQNKEYFNEEQIKEELINKANQSYLPMNKLLLDLIKKHNGEFKCTFSISGIAIEEMRKYTPDVLDSFRELAKTGCVEFLSETYYHSLSFLYSQDEFKKQIEMHRQIIKDEFGCNTQIFRNTELIYTNELANFLEEMNFKGILAEGWHTILDDKSPNFLYNTQNSENNLTLFLRNHKLSEDIEFRFSNIKSPNHTLTVKKYKKEIKLATQDLTDDVLNLFMNYDTFGMKHSKTTGIFNFFKEFAINFLEEKEGHNFFTTPSECLTLFKKREKIDVPFLLSSVDYNRDLSPWIGNEMQYNSIKEMFAIEKILNNLGNIKLLNDWRKLSSSDNFYSMNTKYWKNGDCPEYYAIHKNPYDEYINFMNILNDIIVKIKLEENQAIVSATNNC